MTDKQKPQRYLVQRRLPGIQGENGCWQDAGEYEATSPAGAIEVALEGKDDSYVRSGVYWRVALSPEWARFIPSVRTSRHTTVNLGEMRDEWH